MLRAKGPAQPPSDDDAQTLPKFESGSHLKTHDGPAQHEDSEPRPAPVSLVPLPGVGPVSIRAKSSSKASTTPPLALDQTKLGPYQVVCELASGGMATVYLALYRSIEGFEKLCAVKRIHPHLANDRAFANMFVDEAQIAARISHPFVCSVFSFGKTQKSHYIAMEFLRGEPLSALSRRVARSPELGDDPRFPALAARLVANLAEGLHAAHTLRDVRGVAFDVVHRDVTPQNLFVLYDGSVRVTDFGIAHARRRLHQTEGQKLKGKLSYVAPEQLTGAAVDLRVDVWGLGVVLWEMLAGRRLFLGSSEGETLSAVMSREVRPPSEFRANVPVELDRIVLRALERDLDRRYRSARDMSRDLERFLSASGDAMPAMDVADWMTRIFPDGLERIQSLVDLAAQVSAATADETVVRVPSAPPPHANPRPPQESWSSLIPPSIPTVPDRPAQARDTAAQQATTLAPPRLEAPVSAAQDSSPKTPASYPKSFHISVLDEHEPTTLQRASLGVPEEVSQAFELVRPRKSKRLHFAFAVASAVGVLGVITLWRHAPPSATAPVASAAPANDAASVAPAQPAEKQAAATPAAAAVPTDPTDLPLAEADTSSRAKWAGAKHQAAIANADGGSSKAPARAAQGQGTVFVTTPGASGEVFEHGRPLGRAPGVFRLPVGHHSLEIRPAQGAPRSVSVEIADRATTLVTVSLGP